MKHYRVRYSAVFEAEVEVGDGLSLFAVLQRGGRIPDGTYIPGTFHMKSAALLANTGPPTAASVAALVEKELDELSRRKPARATRIRHLLVTPEVHELAWDYGEPGQTFTAWKVAEHAASGTGFFYCEHGFGPTCPWGLVRLADPGIGMDSGWFARFGDAVMESHV